MKTFCKNKLVGVKFLMGLLMVIWSATCFGQSNSSDNDPVTEFVLNEVTITRDRLTQLVSSNTLDKTELEKVKEQISLYDNYYQNLSGSYTFVSQYKDKRLSKSELDEKIKYYKAKKADLKNIMHDQYNKQITDLYTRMSDLELEIRNSGYKDEAKKNELENIKAEIFQLKCEAKLIEIDLMITSRELTYLWNIWKERYEE